MPQFGSNPSVAAQNQSATQDPNGNPIISQANNFGASPLGVAARTQTLYGIPNANFDLTCADPGTAVAVDNAIPYWSLETAGTISTTMVYNATTQNWSVRMDPTGAASGDSAILKTRTYLLNDDALALRQKAYASLTRQGTTGTAQWSIVLSATYYDDTGAQLSTYNVGTAADTGTWTGINGITTSGSAAISSSAAYADIALTLTAAGSVSGTAKVDINSVLIATSSSATGTFLIAQRFTANGTWTRPTGVDYVTIVVASGGQGGSSGYLTANSTSTAAVGGGAGGKSGAWAMVRDIALGTATTVSVGVGAGGAGGTALTFSKLAAGTATSAQTSASGADGGASTFGSYLSVAGGKSGNVDITYGFFSAGGGTAAAATAGVGVNTTQKGGSANELSAYTLGAPFTTFSTGGVAGVTASGSGGSGTATAGGTAGTAVGILGGGGGGANGTAGNTLSMSLGGDGGAAGAGSGGGGAARFTNTNTQTIVVTGGAGGSALANSGAGGGGGGCAAFAQGATYSTHTLTMNSGAGGAGAAGFVTVVWVG